MARNKWRETNGEKQMVRLYISAMETFLTGEPVFDSQAGQLLTRLTREGYLVHWEKQWRSYEIIEQEIAASEALLAIVDETWRSSTWMGSEVTWANGQGGALPTSNAHIKPIPIFLYPVAEVKPWFPFSYDGPMLLSRNVDTATRQILDALPLHRAV
jgi:hypothetical protein